MSKIKAELKEKKQQQVVKQIKPYTIYILYIIYILLKICMHEVTNLLFFSCNDKCFKLALHKELK